MLRAWNSLFQTVLDSDKIMHNSSAYREQGAPKLRRDELSEPLIAVLSFNFNTFCSAVVLYIVYVFYVPSS